MMIKKYKMPKQPSNFIYKEEILHYFIDLEEKDALGELPFNLRYYYVLDTLINDVNNGGFGQYISNCPGHLQYLQDVAVWLGYDKFSQVIEKFIRLYNQGAGEYETVDDEFYNVSEDEIKKKARAAYKSNYQEGCIEIPLVKEKISDVCNYFVYKEKLSLPQALDCFLDLLSDLSDHQWEIKLNLYDEGVRMGAYSDGKWIDLKEVVAHFAEEDYSFKTHGYVETKNNRKGLTFFGGIQITSTVADDDTMYTLNDVNVTKSGFDKQEFKVKERFAMKLWKSMTKSFTSITLKEVAMDLLDDVQNYLVEKAGSYPNIIKISVEEGRVRFIKDIMKNKPKTIYELKR